MNALPTDGRKRGVIPRLFIEPVVREDFTERTRQDPFPHVAFCDVADKEPKRRGYKLFSAPVEKQRVGAFSLGKQLPALKILLEQWDELLRDRSPYGSPFWYLFRAKTEEQLIAAHQVRDVGILPVARL